MNNFERYSKRSIGLMVLLLTALAAGCGGGGSSDSPAAVAAVVVVPAVTSTSPANGATGVSTNGKIIAAFSIAMDPATIIAANVTVTSAPGATAVPGTVTYSTASSIVTFTPTAVGGLASVTTFTATITAAAKSTAGVALAADYVWSFRTGSTPDTTPPSVPSTSTAPASASATVSNNQKITVSFTEAMDPATINGTTFTLSSSPGAVPVAGTVTYTSVGNTAIFTPAANLTGAVTYTATVTNGVKDLAGNAMAANFVFSFKTGLTTDTTAPTITTLNPVNQASAVCNNKTINATFSESMDPATLNTTTFSLKSTTAGASVVGTVSYDAATNIASFKPNANLISTPATGYTATIKGGASGVKDLAGNALAADSVSTFTTSAATTCATAPALGAAAVFGGFGGNATVTNQGLNTVINGDLAVNASAASITGLRDSAGNVYTTTTSNDGLVTGRIYAASPTTVQARSDALTAFNSLSPASLPGGLNVAVCPGCGGAGDGPDALAGRTLLPGVYLSTTGTYDIGQLGRTQQVLTLDGGGDANAVWVFQTAAGTGTLTVGVTGAVPPATTPQVLLINGAQSKNVYWYVPAGASIGTGSTMVGTMLADASITISTTGGTPPTAPVTTLNGRAIALTAALTMVNTVINIPAP